ARRRAAFDRRRARRAATAAPRGDALPLGRLMRFSAMRRQALAEAMQVERPSDVALRAFFRARPGLGRRDRARIAESVFDVLRQRRLYERLLERDTARERVVERDTAGERVVERDAPGERSAAREPRSADVPDVAVLPEARLEALLDV